MIFENFREKLKLLSRLLFLLFLAFTVFIMAIFYANKKISEPKSFFAKEAIFEVMLGQGAKEIARNLQEQGFIANDKFFLIYLWQIGGHGKLQAGRYSLSASQTIKEIADKMIKGEAIKDEIQVTIPEGFRLLEVENQLVGGRLILRDDLLNYNYDSTKVIGMYDFLRIDCKGRYCGLEGYLFPDTYKFSTAKLPLNRDEVVIKFLDNFELKTKYLRIEAKKKGIDFNEIVIMASILEKEVRTPEDMKIIAGILWKRISIGMPLQVDATIAYITGKKTGEITYDDLKIDNRLNTYLYKGLPLDPISNPGLVALDAALNPIQSNYLYYLSKPTGETVFSKTLEEHNKAKNLYLK